MARLLRELPDGAQGPYDFREFQRRARTPPAGAGTMANARALVATAVIAVAVCATATRFGPIQPASPSHAANATDPTAQPGRDPAPRNDASYTERWLESLPREPALVHVGTRSAVATLEDDIAQVDDLVSAARASRASPAGVQPLLEERAQLVNSLVQVRYAETLADASR